MKYQPHPAAELFPLMSGAEFDGLVADIRDNGLRDPIILHEGLILDGRNRYAACESAGVEPSFVEWAGEGSVESFVVSKNLHRRHLNEAQRALIAAKLATLRLGDNQHKTEGTQICAPKISISEAAEMLNVSPRSVTSARTVMRQGTPEEIKLVEDGGASVNTIAKQIISKEPAEKRAQKRNAPLSQSGKNPERIQRQQINAEIWGRVRDALTHLTSLPIPGDVVAIVRANDRTGLVDSRSAAALQWLKEFNDVWNNGREDAA